MLGKETDRRSNRDAARHGDVWKEHGKRVDGHGLTLAGAFGQTTRQVLPLAEDVQ